MTTTETLTAGANYDYATDTYRVEIRDGEWDDYDVTEVIEVPSGNEDDAVALAQRIATERGINVRDAITQTWETNPSCPGCPA